MINLIVTDVSISFSVKDVYEILDEAGAMDVMHRRTRTSANFNFLK